MNAVRSTLCASAMLLAGVLFVGGAALALGQVPGRGPIVPAAASAEQASFDQPIAWMHEAKHNYTAVKDYTCTLVSREKVSGRLGDENIIQMKFRSQPFSVYLRWLGPKDKQGQEVAFIKGKNNDKMRVKSAALPIGFHNIDPTDPRVLQNSRHIITDAGIGNMIDRTIKSWELDRASGKAKAMPPLAASYNKRECFKLEVVHLEQVPQAECYRTVMYVEKVSKMPIRLENYAWPQKGGSPDGELLEMFSYVNIQWNVGLNETDFAK